MLSIEETTAAQRMWSGRTSGLLFALALVPYLGVILLGAHLIQIRPTRTAAISAGRLVISNEAFADLPSADVVVRVPGQEPQHFAPTAPDLVRRITALEDHQWADIHVVCGETLPLWRYLWRELR